VKPFDFRLARVLRLKEQKKRQAELLLQHVAAVLQGAQAEVAALQNLLVETATRTGDQAGQAVQAATWIARALYIGKIKQSLELAETKVQQAQYQFQEANQQRLAITTEVEALLFLRKQQWQEYRRGVAREEQIQRDERAVYRWNVGREQDGFGTQTPKEVKPS